MGFLAKLFRVRTNDHLQGTSLGAEPAWSVTGIDDASEFFRLLPSLIPSGSVLFLEGVYSDAIIDYLKQHPSEHRLKIAGGTIWPKPRCFHILITEETALDLARLSESCANPEVCSHLHVYRDEQVLASWYDAFDDPLRISTSIPEERIQELCRKLDRAYQLESTA